MSERSVKVTSEAGVQREINLDGKERTFGSPAKGEEISKEGSGSAFSSRRGKRKVEAVLYNLTS